MNKKEVNSNPTKEFFSILKNIEKNTKNQARISSYNPEDVSSFMVEICPIKGVYQHAKFLFQIKLMFYPREFPNVICLSDIYHPNIEHGENYHNVCLNLFDNWNRSFGLMDVIQGLIFLLYQPNLSDPISSFFNSKNTNEEIFRKNVHTSLHGGIVDGIKFLPNPGIIEYNETINKKVFVEEKLISVDKKVDNLCGVIESIIINDKNEETNCWKEEFDKDVEITVTMTNNNAAALLSDIDSRDCAVIDDVDGVLGAEQQEDEGEGEDETEEEEMECHLPTRDIISPTAFYSDIICSRYPQPDKLSESETGSVEMFHSSIVFNMSHFPISSSSSSSYASAESEICHGFDSCYYFDDDDDDDDNDDNCEDCDSQFVRQDDFICPPSNSRDPSSIFLSKWLEQRALNGLSRQCPPPVTSIILSTVLNPFRNIIGTFYLCDVENYRSWLSMDQSVYMMKRRDCSLHCMVWLQNICRWIMGRAVRRSSCYSGYCGEGQLLWYCLYLGLSYTICRRLTHSYNYGTSSSSNCLFLR